MSDLRHSRVRSVERALSGSRRLVHAIGAARAVELSGSAPVVWDLLAEVGDTPALHGRLTDVYDDHPDAISAGLSTALTLLRDAELITSDATDEAPQT